MNSSLDERYSGWLYRQVCSPRWRSPSRKYAELFHILFTKEFVWFVPNDDNRVEDGKDLRHEFLADEGIRLGKGDAEWLCLGCSFLEFLIALARRAAFEDGATPRDWFWIFLRNLELDEYNDTVDFDSEKVEEILDRVIWRTYKRNGQGGLFPLNHPAQDQRKVEIWYQLGYYILERELLAEGG